MSAASAPLAGSSTTSALLSASLLRPTAATALDSLHRQRTLISSPSSVIMLLSSCDGRPYTLKLAKAAETGGETDTTQPQIRFVRLTLSGFPSRTWMRLLRSLLTVEYTHLITTSRLLIMIIFKYTLKLIQLYQIRLRPTNVNITPSDPQRPNVSSIYTGPFTLHVHLT